MSTKPTTRSMFETEDLPLFSGTPQRATGDPFKPTTAYRQARIAALPPMLDSRLSFANADSHDVAPEHLPPLDLHAESGRLFEWDNPDAASTSGHLRPGITRAHAERYAARKSAVELARRTKYRTTGKAVALAIDCIFANGYTQFEKLPRGTIRLSKPGDYSGTDTYVVYRKVEADYVRVRLNIEPLARTY